MGEKPVAQWRNASLKPIPSSRACGDAFPQGVEPLGQNIRTKSPVRQTRAIAVDLAIPILIGSLSCRIRDQEGVLIQVAIGTGIHVDTLALAHRKRGSARNPCARRIASSPDPDSPGCRVEDRIHAARRTWRRGGTRQPGVKSIGRYRHCYIVESRRGGPGLVNAVSIRVFLI